MASWIKRSSKHGVGTTRTTKSTNISTGKVTRSFSSKPSASTRVTKTDLGSGKIKTTTTQHRSDGSSKRTTHTVNSNKKPKFTAVKSIKIPSPSVKPRPKTKWKTKSKPIKFSTLLWIIVVLYIIGKFSN